MSTFNLASLIIMALFYIFAGVSHFSKPNFFMSITPKWVPFPKSLNLIIGSIEIILGLLLLFSKTQSFAAWSIIILLIVVFPANVYHFQKALFKKKNVIVSFIRLPLQFVLIYWAYSFS